MINKILVPLDGSTVAENVLPLARSFAGALHVPVKLLDNLRCSRDRAPNPGGAKCCITHAAGRYDAPMRQLPRERRKAFSAGASPLWRAEG